MSKRYLGNSRWEESRGVAGIGSWCKYGGKLMGVLLVLVNVRDYIFLKGGVCGSHY